MQPKDADQSLEVFHSKKKGEQFVDICFAAFWFTMLFRINRTLVGHEITKLTCLLKIVSVGGEVTPEPSPKKLD